MPTLHLHNVIDAIEQALIEYGIPEIINCDNGNQFTSPSNAYSWLLTENGITMSFNRKGKPNNNNGLGKNLLML